ncbi:TIGR04283 family arsenosugar biosynthesis glycosyltransferase [Gammaproteobacteria bacterium]|nr:TIGR04283 family arsenosugar biosynthesis glycosyltransferase [Gammaproteobacteria bacterium]
MTDSLISIIIPVLNEAETVRETLQALQPYRQAGHEVIVVDGGSHDKTIQQALSLADKILQIEPGRARQMNEGAAYARHDILLFLHSDTQLPARADAIILAALGKPENVWGRFKLRLSSKKIMFRLIETTINWRTFISGIATGDQAIFIEREIFERVGCYDPIPLMEDVALGKKLLKYARPCCLPQSVLSSSRRWEKHGIVKTIVLMWYLRTVYFFGADPAGLAKRYYKVQKHQSADQF